MSGRCAHWVGAERRYCRAADDVRPFLTGLCCPLHTPAALAGRPEPLPGPGLPEGLPLSPISASRVADERAVASGKRRSSPEAYRAAQEATRSSGRT